MLPMLLAAGFFSDWAQSWADNIGGIVLVVIGMILIVVEMIVPGFGAAGVSRGIALIAGLIFRSALKGKLSRSPVVLNTAIDADSSERSGEEMRGLVGKTGTTLTALRPSGIAMIDGKRIDVSSEAEFIDKGVRIEVVSVDGMRVLVKRA